MGMKTGWKAERKAAVILVLALFNYLFLNLFPARGWMAYFLPSVCWGTLALVAFWACGLDRIRSWFNAPVSLAAASVSILYVLVLLNLGFFMGFGRSPYSFAPLSLLTNSFLVLSTLLGMELSRSYLVKNLGRGRPFLTLGSVTLFYAFLGISTAKLLGLRTPLAATKFLGTGFLPLLAENLLVTYLAFLGGPVASLAYRLPLTAFWWFCPILPRLSWAVEALVGVMIPTAGFFSINLYTPPFTLRRLGFTSQGGFKARESQARGLVIASVLCVVMVWASTGLLGLRVTTVLSGSMSPSLEVGDVAVVREVSPSSVRPGDVIQFARGGEAVIHRVVEVRQEGGSWSFITKGDANSSPDPTPVSSSQLMGKVIMRIPKVGWAILGVKGVMVGLWSFVREHTALVLSLPLLAVPVFLGRRYRWRKVRWGLGKEVSSRRWGTPLVFLMLFLSVGGIAYAHWSEPLYVSGTVETGIWKSEIECYKVWSFPCCQVNSWRSEDNRTLYLHYWYTYPCDTVWVVLKIHNTGTVPIFFQGFQYQFSGKDFKTYEWFFGPYGDGCQQGDCCWWKDLLCGDGCDGPDERTCCWMDSCCLKPPIQLHPCQSLIAVVKLKSFSCSCDFTISMSIKDVCWSCLGRT
ncbi:MAG: signal peptidase I [Candidatus Hadarchaeales archaeon]